MIYGLTNSKGGVGKTTIAVHLAAFLAKKKREVVFIDADPQQSASTWIRELALPIRLARSCYAPTRFSCHADRPFLISAPLPKLCSFSMKRRANGRRRDSQWVP